MAGFLMLAVASCMSPPTSSSSAAPVGSANAPEEATLPFTPPSTTHPAPLQHAKVDQSQTQALTDYLKTHHLPLVGAQVLSNPSGQRQVILFGYVATEYGKGDAESRVKRYINNPAVTVDNRIKIEPSLAKPAATYGSQTADNSVGNTPGIDAYENQQYQDQLQQQQMYSYQGQGQNPGASPMATIIPLLGMFGGSFGGGSFGFSGGVVGPSFGGGGYGAPPPSYPSYPYP